MAVSIDEPPPTATTASNRRPVDSASRAKATASSIDSSVGSTRARSKMTVSMPCCQICSAIRVGWPVASTPGVGDEQHPAGAERRQVVAHLGGRAGAELERRGGVGEDGLAHAGEPTRRGAAQRGADHGLRTAASARAPEARPSAGTQAAASVVPSTSTTRGSLVGHLGVEDDLEGVEVLAAARTAPCPRSAWSVTSRTSPGRARPARSPRAPRGPRPARGSSPWSMPPPGSVHSPGCGPRARVAGQQHLVAVAPSRTASAYAATRCSWNGRCSASTSVTRPTTGTDAVEDRRRAASRRPPSSSRRPRRRAARGCRPAPSRRRRSAARARRPAGPAARCCAGGRSRRARSRRSMHVQPGLLVHLADHRVARVLAVLEAAAGQRPQLLAGQPLGQPAEQDVGSSRRMTAYAATRCTFRTCRPPLRHATP